MHLKKTQYLVRIPISRLEQLIIVSRGVHVQQTVVITIHVNIPIVNDYMSMVIMFHFSNQEGLIYIHNRMENRLEVCLMGDHQEEDHHIKTHLEDCYLIHLLDFTNGQHLIQECSCHHGIH